MRQHWRGTAAAAPGTDPRVAVGSCVLWPSLRANRSPPFHCLPASPVQVGLFIMGLWVDSLQGAADDSLRVKYRATQVRARAARPLAWMLACAASGRRGLGQGSCGLLGMRYPLLCAPRRGCLVCCLPLPSPTASLLLRALISSPLPTLLGSCATC